MSHKVKWMLTKLLTMILLSPDPEDGPVGMLALPAIFAGFVTFFTPPTGGVATVEGFAPPVGEVYQVIESPRGELGYYVVSDGTSKPYRVHIHGPSFGNLQGLPKMVEGLLISDVIASLGSMDFVLGDSDR